MKRSIFLGAITSIIFVTSIFLMPAMAADNKSPAQITDLTPGTIEAFSVILTWTAPGDDNMTGLATEYDLRYSLSMITAANWDTAIQLDNEPKPSIPGQQEYYEQVNRGLAKAGYRGCGITVET